MKTFFANIGLMAVVILVLFIIKNIDHYLYCKKINHIEEDDLYFTDIDED
jgi:hypothetical protein